MNQTLRETLAEVVPQKQAQLKELVRFYYSIYCSADLSTSATQKAKHGEASLGEVKVRFVFASFKLF